MVELLCIVTGVTSTRRTRARITAMDNWSAHAAHVDLRGQWIGGGFFYISLCRSLSHSFGACGALYFRRCPGIYVWLVYFWLRVESVCVRAFLFLCSFVCGRFEGGIWDRRRVRPYDAGYKYNTLFIHRFWHEDRQHMTTTTTTTATATRSGGTVE